VEFCGLVLIDLRLDEQRLCVIWVKPHIDPPWAQNVASFDQPLSMSDLIIRVDLAVQ
jgi:hypothetical protein